MLITKEVEISASGRMTKYYEKLGYVIPREVNKYGRYAIPIDAKLKIKIEDLSPRSNIMVEALCDYCLEEGKKTIVPKVYNNYYRDNVTAII